MNRRDFATSGIALLAAGSMPGRLSALAISAPRPRPFLIQVPERRLADIARCVSEEALPPRLGEGGWSLGMDGAYMSIVPSNLPLEDWTQVLASERRRRAARPAHPPCQRPDMNGHSYRLKQPAGRHRAAGRAEQTKPVS